MAESASAREGHDVRRPYSKPRVVDYGSVRSITLGSSDKKPDKGSKSPGTQP
jgi:hypothetical protein